MKRGKGLSSIVSVLLIILISFVAIAIIWVVIRNVINQNSEQISLGKVTVSLDLQKVQMLQGNSLSLKVRRQQGAGTFTGLKFIFEGKKVSEVVTMENLSMAEYEVRTLVFNLKKINVSDIEKIEISPIFTLASGKQTTGDVKDSWIVEESPFESGGSAYQCSDSCSSLGYNCGTQTICGATMTCGSCGGNQQCVSGVCVATGDTCASLGFACGVVNGVTCGNCQAGQICSAGSCITQCTNTCDSLNYDCGSWTVCGTTTNCGSCSSGYTCSSAGQCVANPNSCTDTCASLGYACGTHTVCGVSTNCGSCSSGTCNSAGQCVATCTDTCSSLGYNCGTQTVCGVSTNCGSCSSGQTCSSGTCISDTSWQTGILSWWRLDSGASDSVGSNSGTINGATQSSGCKSGNCYSFDGVDDYISISPVTLSRTGATISLWFYTDSNFSSNYVSTGDILSNGNKYNSYVGISGSSYMRGESNVNEDLWAYSSISDPRGGWHNIIISAQSNGTIYTYYDGVYRSSRTATNDFTISQFSSSYATTGWNGLIDEVIFWNRGLSPAEILNVYNYF